MEKVTSLFGSVESKDGKFVRFCLFCVTVFLHGHAVGQDLNCQTVT